MRAPAKFPRLCYRLGFMRNSQAIYAVGKTRFLAIAKQESVLEEEIP